MRKSRTRRSPKSPSGRRSGLVQAVREPARSFQSVVAPFDGVITQRNIDVGSLVQADATSGTFLFTLVHSGTLRIQLYVPQDQAFGVAPGVDAVIRVPEMPDREFPGRVTRIANALQPGSRTLLTEIDVPNPDYVLSPGVYCTVELKIPRKTPSLIVPAEAIVFNRDGLNVAVVENGVAHIHHVTVVRDLGTAVEVSAGVKDTDQAILNPPVDLTDGHKVDQQRPSAGGRRRRPRWLAMTISRVASLISSSLADAINSSRVRCEAVGPVN